MHEAYVAGADFVKLFPSPPDIAQYVAQALGPLPHLRIFPTSGVTPDNFIAVLRAGASGAGFVRSLFAPSDMESRNFEAIRRRACDIWERYETMKRT